MPASEIDILATYLCCADKYHHIESAMHSRTSKGDVTKLRDLLRSRTAHNHLPSRLESMFNHKIESMKTVTKTVEKTETIQNVKPTFGEINVDNSTE
jgi:hypothetical protein